MSIDLFSEELITLTDVAKKLPGRDGRSLHHSTLVRWARRGIAGERLPAVKIGGAFYTTLDRVNEFLNHVSHAERKRAADRVRKRYDAVTRAETYGF